MRQAKGVLDGAWQLAISKLVHAAVQAEMKYTKEWNEHASQELVSRCRIYWA